VRDCLPSQFLPPKQIHTPSLRITTNTNAPNHRSNCCCCLITNQRGDVRRVLDDVGTFKPTAFAGVPRVFDKIYSGATAKVRRA
jgi:long-subunit acyl-CoA synthetase (AMP-forming)